MTEKEKNSIPVDLISRYLSGEANTDDIIDLERWKAASEENRRTFDQYRRIWETTGRLTIFTDVDIAIDHEWDTILSSTVEDTVSAVPKFSLRLMPLFLRIAAVTIIALLLAYSAVFIYRTFSYEKISASTGKATIDLPDGSHVTLNRGAVLEFPRKFDKGRRNVRLDGEAFFDVQRDISRPFTVQSGNFVLQVLGTSFNVEASRMKDIVEVIVARGEVEVYPRNREHLRQIISPGQKAFYSREKKEIYKISNSDPNYEAWKTGIMHFQDVMLQSVAASLEDVYGKRVVFANENLKKCRITVNFENEPLENVEKKLEEMLHIQITEKEEGTLEFSGQGC